jgi:hypothetical protein
MADIKQECNDLRERIKQLGADVTALHGHDFFSQSPEQRKQDAPRAQEGEMRANITLSYRHLEDARMRIGKIIQALEGGVSIFDK